MPEKVYNFGREFVKERKGQLAGSELDLLLYELNIGNCFYKENA